MEFARDGEKTVAQLMCIGKHLLGRYCIFVYIYCHFSSSHSQTPWHIYALSSCPLLALDKSFLKVYEWTPCSFSHSELENS